MENKQIVKFSVTEAAIISLADKYADPQVPTNKDEYDELKAGIKEVSTVRIAIDKERKTQTAAALAHQRAVNAEGKRIIGELKAIEEPMKLCKAEVDEAEERRVREAEEREAARLETIRSRLQNIEHYGVVSITDTLDNVKKRLERVKELDPTTGFDEFAKQASENRQKSLDSLSAAIVQIEDREKVAAEQAKMKTELDKRAREIAEQEKAANLEREKLEKEKNDREAAERKVEQDRLKALEDEKREQQAKDAAAAEQARQRELAPDREKIRVFAQSLKEVPLPWCSSDAGIECVRNIVDLVNVLVSEIESQADLL